MIVQQQQQQIAAVAAAAGSSQQQQPAQVVAVQTSSALTVSPVVTGASAVAAAGVVANKRLIQPSNTVTVQVNMNLNQPFTANLWKMPDSVSKFFGGVFITISTLQPTSKF